MKPPFTYFGGKTAIAEQIADLLPPHEHYVEPFAGSLAVLLAKPPRRWRRSTTSTADLMTFWRVLRDARATWSALRADAALARRVLRLLRASRGRA